MRKEIAIGYKICMINVVNWIDEYLFWYLLDIADNASTKSVGYGINSKSSQTR